MSRHRRHGNPYSVRGEIARLDPMRVFGRAAPYAIDVGFGSGEFPLAVAQEHPEWNVLGIEIRDHLVDALNAAAEALGLRNVHGILANANQHLEALVPVGAAVFVSVNFPDPWFKRGQQKRRVVNEAWLQSVARVLAPGGVLHVMTDFEPIATDVARASQTLGEWFQPCGAAARCEQPTTPYRTRREQRHTERGDPIYRFRLVRTAAVSPGVAASEPPTPSPHR